MLMYFSSGTSGNPKMVLHDSGYALAHLVTAKHWHNVNPEGLHFTIADTGWGKAVWGKFFGQWLMEAARAHLRLRPLRSGRDPLPRRSLRRDDALLPADDVPPHDRGGRGRLRPVVSLEYCTTAGEALNPDLFDFWREHTGLTIYEGFGQTETPLTVAQSDELHAAPGLHGQAGAAVRHGGSSATTAAECDTGETGEICISIDPHPAGIMMEYYRDAEKTAEAMHDGWYHTGDTAWRDEEGNYWYVGRNDDVIKSSGYRIGPFEIESRDARARRRARGAPSPACPTRCAASAVKATVVLADGLAGKR